MSSDTPIDVPVESAVPPGHVYCSPLSRLFSKREYDQLRARLAMFNRTLPEQLVEVRVPTLHQEFGGLVSMEKEPPLRAWRSRTHIAMVFAQGTARRLSVVRAKLNDAGTWEDGMTWDELMSVKQQAGYGGMWAVELYPPAESVVNVANMRHLWFLREKPPFAW